MGLAEGARIGRYSVVGELGAGGMGEVYRAIDTQLRRPVAVKILRDGAGDTPELRRRFEREARAISALNHPNVVAIHDVGEQDGHVYFVTELLEGESLRERLRRGPIPRGEAIEIARHIARGLEAIHGRDIVHRDLKPSNLFLCADGTVKIIDFGIARHRGGDETETHTQSGSVLGTPRYMAPEQVRGRSVDARTDVFAFGLVVYEMLAGAPPFEAASDLEAAAAILELDPAPLGDPALDDLIERCLAKEPDDRCANATELLAILDALAAGAAPPRRRTRRRWRHLAIAGAVGLAAAAAVALVVARSDDEAAPSAAPPSAAAAPEMRKITNVPSPRSAGAYAVTHDGSRLVYWEPGTNRTTAQDVVTGERRLLTLPEGVHTLGPLGFFPDDRLLGWAIRRDADNSLIALDLDTGATTELWPTDAYWWALSPGGDAIAYFENNRLLVRRIDGGDPRPLLTKPEAFNLAPPAWSPDGTRLALMYAAPSDRGIDLTLEVTTLDGQRSVLPIGDAYVPGSVGVYPPPIGACWLDDGRLVYLDTTPAGDSELWEIGVDGTTWDGRPPRKRATLPETAWFLRSAAGKVFFHQTRQYTDVALIDYTETGDLYAPALRLTDTDGVNVSSGWTAEGRALITTDMNGTHDVVSMAPGVAPRLVAGGPLTELEPAAAGDAILFWRKRGLDDDNCTLYRIDDEGETELLETGADHILCPPIGCARDAPDRCFIIERDGPTKNVRRLDPRTGHRGDVVFTRDAESVPEYVEMSPDGRQIALPTESKTAEAITVIDLDTGVSTDYPTAPLVPLGVAWTDQPGTWLVAGKMPAEREFDSGVIATVSTSGTISILRRFDAFLTPWRPSLSPDGTTISMTMPRKESNIWVMEGL